MKTLTNLAKTFGQLTFEERLALVAFNNTERLRLANEAQLRRKAKQTKTKREKKPVVPKFDVPFLNELFSKLDPSLQRKLL